MEQAEAAPIPEAAQPSVSVDKLIENARAALMGAIELHNKPIFPNRYEVVVVLIINAWELALKAYIIKYQPEQPMFNKEGNSMPIDKCLSLIESKLGKDFMVSKESIERIYEYRCNIIHFYSENLQPILFTLLHPNILLLSDFFKAYFSIDLGEETNLVILPLGFKRSVSPIEFLSQQSMEGSEYSKKFITSIIKSAQILHENGINDGLLCNYGVYVGNASRIKNADIVVGITNDPTLAAVIVHKEMMYGGFTNDNNAQKVQLDNVALQKLFPMTYTSFIKAVKNKFPTFRETTPNLALIKEIKKNPDFCYTQNLDLFGKSKGSIRIYYSEMAVTEMIRLLNGD